MAINNRNLDFVQTRGLILLINDNHADNYLKEILLYVYFGLIVKIDTKKTENLPNVSTVLTSLLYFSII